jgi:hypothetical protein
MGWLLSAAILLRRARFEAASEKFANSGVGRGQLVKIRASAHSCARDSRGGVRENRENNGQRLRLKIPFSRRPGSIIFLGIADFQRINDIRCHSAARESEPKSSPYAIPGDRSHSVTRRSLRAHTRRRFLVRYCATCPRPGKGAGSPPSTWMLGENHVRRLLQRRKLFSSPGSPGRTEPSVQFGR